MKIPGYSSSVLLRRVTVHFPSTEQSQCSDCTVNLSKYLENQQICFHHHCQAHLIHYFDQDKTPLLTCDSMQNPGHIQT